jgi:hypothetical protein
MSAPAPLAEALRKAGWGPRQLAGAINGWLSDSGQPRLRINATAPYSWVKQGYFPRRPIPSITATVLSQRLGSVITVEQLWPGRGVAGNGPEIAAADGMDLIRTTEEVMQELSMLASSGIGNVQHVVVGANGADLTAAVLDGLGTTARWTRQLARRERVLPPQVDLIASHVAGLRRLDDRHGGGALSLRYASGELRSVLDLIHSADYEPAVGQRLLTIAADLAQLVGWMQFDSGNYGLAERYLLLSGRITRSSGQSGRFANAIGMLAYVSSFAGHGAEALRLAEAALRAYPQGDPILLARLRGREATAAAAAGDLSRFRAASEAARGLLSAHQTSGAPAYLYYLELQQLTAEAGQGLVWLADGTGAFRRSLLREAIELLEPISVIGQRPDYPRSALLHATFLAEAHLHRNDVEHAVDAIRAAMSRLGDVQSPRGKANLRRLRPALARRKRSAAVADLLPELEAVLPST